MHIHGQYCSYNNDKIISLENQIIDLKQNIIELIDKNKQILDFDQESFVINLINKNTILPTITKSLTDANIDDIINQKLHEALPKLLKQNTNTSIPDTIKEIVTQENISAIIKEIVNKESISDIIKEIVNQDNIVNRIKDIIDFENIINQKIQESITNHQTPFENKIKNIIDQSLEKIFTNMSDTPN